MRRIHYSPKQGSQLKKDINKSINVKKGEESHYSKIIVFSSGRAIRGGSNRLNISSPGKSDRNRSMTGIHVTVGHQTQEINPYLVYAIKLGI